MQIPKSGSLTSKNGGIISLTPEDLRNHSFAVFSINCKRAVIVLGLKDAPIDTSFVPQVSCLNSQSCGNNQPNLFSEGPLHRVQLHHVTVT